MKKFVQIYNNKAHWIFEAEEKPEFAPNIIIKEITNLEVQPQEGWDYDDATDTFSEPKPIEPELYQPTEYETLSAKVDYLTILVEPTEV